MRGILKGALLAASISFGFASAAAQDLSAVQRSGNTFYKAACGNAVGFVARCHAYVVTDAKGNALGTKRGERISGFGAPDLRSAYNITTDGSSSTIIALVDAFGYDNAEADLGVYRTNYGLPDCTTANGCFKKLNQHGKEKNYPAQDIGWAQESALDLDMASAMCPNCKIYLVEATNNSLKNLGSSVNTAAGLGAHVISNSYGGGEGAAERHFDTDYYTHPGVAITASSGDKAFAAGPQFPATASHVTAVGGTHLVKDSSTRGWTETAWSGAGSGCSKFVAKPTWQTDAGCKKRMEADVSAVADPATGVAVYGPNNSGVSAWLRFGGTSVAAPLVGGIFANNGGTVTDGNNPYAHVADLYDVVGGNNGTCKAGKNGQKSYYCTAVAGYDGPTGLGTPNGTAAFGD
jgi:subtilase family serine protease